MNLKVYLQEINERLSWIIWSYTGYPIKLHCKIFKTVQLSHFFFAMSAVKALLLFICWAYTIQYGAMANRIGLILQGIFHWHDLPLSPYGIPILHQNIAR
jgi:hypothetical protein